MQTEPNKYYAVNMKYHSKNSLLLNIFLIIMGTGVLLVLGEYLIGKRHDAIEFFAAALMLIFLTLSSGARYLEINNDKKEITLTRWFGLYHKIYKFQDIKDLYVSYSNSIDNWHGIMATTDYFNITLYEYGAFNKNKVIDNINEVYNCLSAVTGIAKKEFEFSQNT